MYPNRPRISIPLERIDVLLEFISLAILIVLWVYIILSYAALPDIVPTHFNANGEVDGTGSKTSIWFLMGIITLVAIGMHILTKYPHIHNYMVDITEENAAHNYKMSARLLRYVNLFTLLFLGFIAFAVIRSAGGKEFLGSSMIYIIIAFAVVMPIILIIYIAKNQQGNTSKK